MLKALSVAILSSTVALNAAANLYEFPVAVPNYQGDKTSSVSYSGQSARQVLNNSLKKAIASNDGADAAKALALFDLYFSQTTGERAIIDPVTKGEFVVKQAFVDEVSTDKNIIDKAYKGAIAGWPGYMTAAEVLKHMVAKAAQTEGGFDPVNGYDYVQLVSKFTMGGVFFNQAVDVYLDEKLSAASAKNSVAAKDGAPYSAIEHSWDEAFGYFGAPAHVLNLSAKEVIGIAKQTPESFAKADFNKDGKIDLKSEMAYSHAYYAASYDATGRSDYLHTIAQAFYDGRKLIADKKGADLTAADVAKLDEQIAIIKTQWQRLNAESVFKYAGAVYADLQKIQVITEANGDVASAYRDYIKHWSELKGFALSLEASGDNLGETGVKLNRLIGFSPVLFGDTQVTGINEKGEFVQSNSINFENYMLHMLKVQLLMISAFDVTAREADATAALSGLAEKLATGVSSEND